MPAKHRDASSDTADEKLIFDEKLAQLFDLETDQEMMRLEPVRKVKIKGGVLIVGDEMHFRGTKSKGEAHRQAWWCTPITRVVQSPRVQPNDPIRSIAYNRETA